MVERHDGGMFSGRSRMSIDPLVSIVIPVFNGANYVAQAIDSALGQTYSNVEVIVVDDGSTDGGLTRATVEGCGSRIRYISKSNGGVATALNSGIQAMRGELFSWLSHDDLYKPQKVERQVETWKSFGASCVVIGDFELMDERGERTACVHITGRNLIARPLDAVFCGLINGCALLVPRELFDRSGFFEPGLPTTQDYHLWYRMARLVPFVQCPFADVRQRIHSSQGSRVSSHLDEASRMFAYLLDQTPADLMRAYDGSELRFLMRVRETLTGSYAGLEAYLRFRIEQLFKKLPYTVVICSEGEAGVASAVEALRMHNPPPVEILTIDLNAAGRSVAGSEPHRERNGTISVFPDGTTPDAVLLAAESAMSTDVVILVRAMRLPGEAQLRAALESLVVTDSDVARPAGAPATASILDGTVARRESLRSLSETSEAMKYEALEPFLAPIADEILISFKGPHRSYFNYGLSETEIARLLLSLLDPQLPTILFIAHSLGGGTSTHLSRLIWALKGKANCLVGFGQMGGHLHLCHGATSADGGLVFALPEQLSPLTRLLRKAGVQRVDVHHTHGFEVETEALLNALGLPFDITLVDYHLLAYNPHLAGGDGTFVGDDALVESGLLRPAQSPILRGAARVIAISRDMAARVERLCPGLPLIAAIHWDDSTATKVRHVMRPGFWGNEPLRVLLAGRIGKHKGRELLLKAAQLSKARDLPIHFHVMGRLDPPLEEHESFGEALTIHGYFPEGRFNEVLGGIAPHVVWLPSLVPETWSYVLSDVIEAALPIVATSIGSFRERCHGRTATWLLPWKSTAETWIDLFLRLRASRMQEPSIWETVDHLPPAQQIYFDDYLKSGTVPLV
jgi:glycosyltransferase involved in cell wall biosynthesis